MSLSIVMMSMIKLITCCMNRSTGDIFLSAQHQQYPMSAQSSSGLPVIPEMGSSYHTLPSGDHRLTPTSSSPYMPPLGLPSSVPRGPAYRSDDAHSIGHWHSPSNTSHVHPSQTYVSMLPSSPRMIVLTSFHSTLACQNDT